METEHDDLDAMTGIGEGGAPAFVLDQLSLNGDAEIVETPEGFKPKGGFFRVLKLKNNKKNEKPAEERLGDSVQVVFLKIRRALQQRSTDGKLRLWTSEHSSPDDVVELRSSESQKVMIGSARALRDKFEGLRTVQYVYALLLRGSTTEPELVKIKLKGSALGSEVKSEDVKSFYDYIYEERKDAEGKKEHLRHYVTELGSLKEQGKKAYFTVTFERGEKLPDEWCKLSDDTLREVHSKLVAIDAARDRRISAAAKQGAEKAPVEPAIQIDEDIPADTTTGDDINPDDIPF